MERGPKCEPDDHPVLEARSTPGSVLEVRGAWKRFGSHAVLQGIDFRLRAGERVALLGPSGSGKSTLLNCLGGIERLDEGELLLEGNSITDANGEKLAQVRRESISSIFQFFHLLPTLNVAENIEFPLKLLGLDRPTREERVETLLEAVGLQERREGLADELSGGEMQRVAIARALAIRPRVILADEPTGNLDSQTGERILDLLESLTERFATALLLVTHSEAATRICSRIVRMRDGRIVEEAGQDRSVGEVKG